MRNRETREYSHEIYNILLTFRKCALATELHSMPFFAISVSVSIGNIIPAIWHANLVLNKRRKCGCTPWQSEHGGDGDGGNGVLTFQPPAN